jgi:mRNA-degrading endonuclease RelE of RelBE toxin-antitoxin system
MNVYRIDWPEPIINKLKSFQSGHFTPQESYDYIFQVVMETEDLLKNPIIGKSYIEESGEYIGFLRIVVRKFRIYYKIINNSIVIVSVLFPGEA